MKPWEAVLLQHERRVRETERLYYRRMIALTIAAALTALLVAAWAGALW